MVYRLPRTGDGVTYRTSTAAGWAEDDGESPVPADPKRTDLPPFFHWWGTGADRYPDCRLGAPRLTMPGALRRAIRLGARVSPACRADADGR